MEQIQHSLSRLALAKAIKSTDNESEDEAWNKSIIFNQPFIKDLHRQKHQLARQLEKTTPSQDGRPASSTSNIKRHHHHHHQHQHKASSSSGSSLSLTLEKRPLAPKSSIPSQRTCIPSDTEEEEEEESDNDLTEDDETDDGSEVFQVKRQTDVIKKSSTSPLLDQNGISRPVSMESSSNRIVSGVSSPSRNSTSSHVTPLTEEEDDVEEPTIIHHTTSQHNIPHQHHALNQEFPNYIPMQHLPKSPPTPLTTSPMMMDPMYYHRLQHYQMQLQYQQQLQLQYQQQQLYLRSQNPSVFFPPGSRTMMMTTDEPVSMGPPPPPPPHHMSSSSSSYKRMTHPHHHHHRKHRSSSNSSRLSSTDLRRRQEMLKTAAEDLTYSSSASLSMYNMASMPMAPSVPRNSSGGGRRPSYF